MTRFASAAASLAALLLLASPAAAEDAAARPKVGDTATAFELQPLGGTEKVKLADLTKQGPVVLVVLRGYPGYQCPICSRQVGQLLAKAAGFKKKNAQVVMVYPGPSQNLQARAKEFVRGKQIPEHFQILIDPDYGFTNAYNLRWNAPRETAYPATFVIGKDGKIVYANISKGHAGRANAAEVLEAVPGE